MKLHEDSEIFLTYVSSTSEYMGLPEVYIEKDYWVTHSLKKLSESDESNKVVFKGGTSLSKAHKLIHRFSEDIDLAAIADGAGDAKRKRLLKSIEKTASVGLEYLPDDHRNSKGSKFRKTVYRYPREAERGDFGQASPELLLEVNTFTDPQPYEAKLIQTMIAETLIQEDRQDLIDEYDLFPFELNVLSVHRTLVEKLLGIIKDSYYEDPITRLNTRIRHIYDVCMIIRDDVSKDFVCSSDFYDMCQLCIEDEKASWGKEETACFENSLNTAPIFSNFNDWWPKLESTYTGVFSDLVYGHLPNYEETAAVISFLHEELEKQEL